MKDFHLQLPEKTYDLLMAEAARSRVDQATLAREAIEKALVERLAQKEDALLSRVIELFAVDDLDLARLFTATPKAIEQWKLSGVPADRQAKLATMAAIGELLRRKLRSGSIPGVARTVAAAYGGRTMFDMIAADEQEELLEDIRASFDWAATA